jgi:hypothetical protein
MQPEIGVPRSRLEAAAGRLASAAPGYLEQVRAAARHLGIRDDETTEAGAALTAVEELAIIDLEVPTASHVPAGHLVKRAIKKAIAWYLLFVGRQVSALGFAMAHLGTVLLGRIENVERSAVALEADLARLAERVDRLEQSEFPGEPEPPDRSGPPGR